MSVTLNNFAEIPKNLNGLSRKKNISELDKLICIKENNYS